MPGLGPVKIHRGKFAGVRTWRVTGFEAVLIFYREVADGIAVDRVIHAKRDYRRVLRPSH